MDREGPTLSLVSLAMAAAYQRGHDKGCAKGHHDNANRAFRRGWDESYSCARRQTGAADQEPDG